MAKTFTEEQVRELMAKVRKGAISSFSWAQYKAVIEALGGTMESTVVGAPLSYDSNGHTYDARINVYPAKIEAVLARFKQFSAPENPPSKIKVGMLYITKITEDDAGRESRYFEFTGYLGSEGWRVTLDGEQVDVVLDPHRARDYAVRILETGEMKKPKLWPGGGDFMRWLNERGWKERAAEYLGMEEHIPGAQRTKEGTGTCPACFRNIKLDVHSRAGRMVLHGYQRPGIGYVIGNCFGVGHHPYETSREGVDAYIERILQPELKKSTERLRQLKAGEVNEFVEPATRHSPEKRIGRDHPEFDKRLERAIAGAESRVRAVKHDVAVYMWLSKHWEERELPTPGSIERPYLVTANRAINRGDR